MMSNPEYHLQVQVVNWLSMQYPEVKYCASLGGVRVSIGTAVKLKKSGYRKGFPDLMVCKPKGYGSNNFVYQYCGLFIEFKIGNNKPSDEQKEWTKYLLDAGYAVACCYTFDEATKVIKDYLS